MPEDAGGAAEHRAQFSASGYVFEFSGEAELVERLQAAFVDLATTPVERPHVWHIDASGNHTRVVIDGSEVRDWVQRIGVVRNVVSTLTMEVIAAQPTTLHLHAAAVVANGETLLLLAPSGSGKSTLTCALVAAGALYRTDEAVGVHPNGGGVTAYPKPISVKEAGFAAVEAVTGLVAPRAAISWEIPASAFGGLADEGPHPVTTLVFNTYVPDQPVEVEVLHRASAVHRLLTDSQNVELVGTDSLLIAARLAASARCLRVSGGDAAQVARAVLDAHEQAFEPGEVEAIARAEVGAGPSRADGVASVLIDGRAVLFTPDPQRLIELDDRHTVWWVLLDGTDLDHTIDEVVRETGAERSDVIASAKCAVDVFRSLGVLADYDCD
jgi:energy-coupling factor transporter ATP-binding protein EcfA2